MMRRNSRFLAWLLLAAPLFHGCDLLGELPWDHLPAPGHSGPDPDAMDAGNGTDAGSADEIEASADAAPVAEHDATAAEDAAPGLDACCEAPDTGVPPDASSEAGATDCDGGLCTQPCTHDAQCAL